MPYTIHVNGVPVRCETPEEARELARLVAGGEPAKPEPPIGQQATSGSRWTERRIKDFFNNISPAQRKLVELLYNADDAFTDAQLCSQLGLRDGRALAGVWAGLWKNAKKLAADPNEVYIRRKIKLNGKRVHEYTLADSFRTAIKLWRPKDNALGRVR